MLVNEVPVKEGVLKMGFRLDTRLELRGVRIYSQNGEKRVTIEAMAFDYSLYAFSSMMIGLKRLEIGEGNFYIIENIELLGKKEGIEVRSTTDNLDKTITLQNYLELRLPAWR